MRALFTTLAATGHYHPLVPMARALQQAGHEVAFAIADTFQKSVEGSGFRFFSAGYDMATVMAQHGGDMRQRMAEMAKMDPNALRERFGGLLVRQFAPRMLPEVVAAAKSWRPELVVRNVIEVAGCVAAEHLGLPHASIQVGGFRPGALGSDVLTEGLNALRASVGLPPDPQREMPFRYLHLSLMPPSYFVGTGELPPTTHFLRPTTFDQSGSEGLPAWVEQLPPGRPVVYVTLGTVFNKMVPLLSTMVAGLRDEPIEVVVTVGRDVDPAQLGSQPANVHVERYIPNSLILPRCALAVMHGGYSSVMSGLIAGLPMVLVPISADQPMNAQACKELGVAQVLEAAQLTPEAIRERVREGLKNPAYREAAQRFQKELQTLPPLEHGVKLLERLAAEKAPLLAPKP